MAKDGKIDLDGVRHTVERRTDIHYPKPRVLSITQATEMGTVYSAAELDAVSETARRLGLRLHMDGARFANAVAALGVSPKEITWKVGVEVLCFGGTKNGMPVGDAIVFFDRELAEDFAYRCKQAGQLASKMRFIAAPWVGLLEGGAWLEHAQARERLRAAAGVRPARGGGRRDPRPDPGERRLRAAPGRPCWRGFASEAGTSIPSSAPAGPASCAPGRPRRRTSRRCCATSHELASGER